MRDNCRIRIGHSTIFFLTGLLVAGTTPALGGISAVVLRINASNAAGAAAFEVRFIDGTWNPTTGDFTWSRTTPLSLTDPANGALIGTLRSASLLIADEHRLDLMLSVQAGALLTRFDVQSAQLLFTTIPAGDADGRASASFGINDTNFNGGELRSSSGAASGVGSFLGRYNGLYPSGSTFSSLVNGLSVSAGGTASAFQTDPASGYRAVNAAVSNISTYLSFTVTSGDIGTANTSYEIRADGSAPPTDPVPGCDPADVDTIGPGVEPLLFKRSPDLLRVADLEPDLLEATISDVELVDLGGDGRRDLVVAWYATYGDAVPENQRTLTIFFGKGIGFERHLDINLYIPDAENAALSIMRNGTADIVAGDFDGDGDQDLAVTPFFGDELWFIENLGQGVFQSHLKFMFGYNGPANFLSPPKALAADFDLDGRDELVYVCDPIQHLNGRMLHFWHTGSSLSNMQRVDWEGIDGGVFTQWTRTLAVGDFDGDKRPDLCFTGAISPPTEDEPILTFWYNFNPASGRFTVHNEYPSHIISDVVILPSVSGGDRPDILLTSIDGSAVEHWTTGVSGPLNYECAGVLNGYAGLSPERGMAAASADVNRDGRVDVVTKQRLGGRYDTGQIQISLSAPDGGWAFPAEESISSLGFENQASNEILRPNNLAVADMSGNRLPEVIAGFGVTPPESPYGAVGHGTLLVGVWRNSCIGDVTLDGQTDDADITAMLTALAYCVGHPRYLPDADLNKDGCVTSADLAILLDDQGCRATSEQIADLDCDGLITFMDIEPFVSSLFTPDEWQAAHPGCPLQNADINRDEFIDFFDVEGFARLLVGG